MKGLNTMKKKIIRVLDNLTDEFVPDNKEVILNAISNENCNNHPAECIIHKKKPIRKYMLIAACLALLLISVLMVNLINTDLPLTLENGNSNSSGMSNSKEKPEENVNPSIEPSNRSVETPIFNKGELNAIKIGGTVVKTTQYEAQKIFSVNSLPYEMEYSFLYALNSNTSMPFACILTHSSSDKWFRCVVSAETLVDCCIDEYEYTLAGDVKIIFSIEKDHLYASFAIGDKNFLLEAEGFSEKDFVGIVDLLIN